MTPFRSILFPTDFSACAGHAEEYAFAIAQNSKVPLHIVHVTEMTKFYAAGLDLPGAAVANTIESITEQARYDLEQAAESARLKGIEVQTHLVSGGPHNEVVRLAEDLGCGLIVIGTHGRSGFNKLVFGSVCEKVVRHSHVPVLTIKHPEYEFVNEGVIAELKRILCPCDLSGFSNAGTALATALCERFGGTLVLMHVIDTRMDYPQFWPESGPLTSASARPDALRAVKEVAGQCTGIATETYVPIGIPHSEIVRAVKDENIDLVVMATHGRTGIAHALLGSTTEKVVRHAPCPVLTIRPSKTIPSGGESKAAPENEVSVGQR